MFCASLRSRLAHEMLGDDTSSNSDDEFILGSTFFAFNLLHITNNRYIDRAPTYNIRNNSIVLESALAMTDANFLLHFRMQKDSFLNLVEELKEYQEFLPKVDRFGRQHIRRTSVQHQLLVFLYVCGADGSDANYKKVASRFSISHGIVQIFVERCTRAIISLFQNDVLCWPDINERKIIGKRFQDKYNFPNCVGIVDGTVFPLAHKPALCGEEYWYRKGGYSLHCLVICDDEMRILDYLVGYPGSVHDNRVWSKTDQCLRYHQYFSRLQYLLADSAFTTSTHLIAAFKRLRGVMNLPANCELFNTYLAKARIKVEHCIGLLKNRFRCLRELRSIISDERSMKRIIDRITVCFILHNLLLGDDYPENWFEGADEDVQEEDLEYEYDEQFVPHDIEAEGRDRREEMMNFITQLNG
jgi:hypothetical protein